MGFYSFPLRRFGWGFLPFPRQVVGWGAAPSLGERQVAALLRRVRFTR
jgi:hypothetical protein